MTTFTDPPANPPAPGDAPNRSTQDRETFSANMDGAFSWVMVTLYAWITSFRAWFSTFKSEWETLTTSLLAAISGGAFGIDYTFSTTTTAADPGAGMLRLNNATQNAATAIYLDILDRGGANWQSAIDLFDDSTSTIKGFLTIRKADDGTKFLVFALTALSTPAGYRQATVTCTAYSSANPFADGELITVSFTPKGDKGDQGLQGNPGSLAGGNLTGSLNERRVTVASHATTADIWNAGGALGGGGNAIDLTGAATLTDFPDAPQAGARRRLHCGAGVTFTNNANISVQGATNYTTVAGDVVEVEALTVSTFRASVAKADGTPLVVPAPGIIHLREQQPSGTSYSDPLTNTAWTHRTLNTTVQNTITGASRSGSVVTLPAGTYEVEGTSQGSCQNNPGQTIHARLRIANATTSATLLLGDNETVHQYTGTFYSAATPRISGRLTLAAATQVLLQFFWSSSQGYGGYGGTPASSGEPEIYSTLIFRKVA